MNRLYLWLTLASLLTVREVFPSANWTEKTNFGGDARHRSTAFSIGGRGYLGLGHVNSVVDVLYEDFWEYDPATNSWSQKADFGGGQRYHATGFAIGNKAYVGTGRKPGGSYGNDFWCYDPAVNTWTPVANFPGSPRRGAVSFVVNGKGYVGTGQTTSGNSSDFFCYDPASNTWSTAAIMPAPGRTSSVAFSINDKGYVGTGSVGGGTNDFYQYDPATNSWTVKANVGPVLRQEATGFAIGGRGYIGTGDDYSSGNNYDDMWEYDPGMNTWTQVDDFEGLARRYLVSFTIGFRAYSGTGTNGTNFKDFWEFDNTVSILENNPGMIEVKAYPNPASEKINFSIQNIPEEIRDGTLTLFISDLTGKKIISDKLVEEEYSLSRNSLASGIYAYSILYKNNIVRGGKFLFQ